jgi:hypothetical protein
MDFLQRLSKQQKIIGSVIIIVIIGIIVWAVIMRPSDGSRYDKNSKDTVVDPAGKTPELNMRTDAPIYLGFSELISDGMSQYQLQALQDSFYNNQAYRKKELSISVDKITMARDQTSNNFVYSFPFILDQQNSFTARVELTSLSSVHLQVFKDQNVLLYDAGTVNVTSLQ